MIYKTLEFEILIESFNSEELKKIPDFRHVDTVASISDEEFWNDYNERKSSYLKAQQLRESFITGLKKPTKRKPNKSNKVNIPISRKALSESKKPNKGRQVKQLRVIRTSTPRPAKKPLISKSVQFDKTSSVGDLTVKKVQRPVKSLTPTHKTLLDLIPVDVDALDLELDRLLLTNNSNQEFNDSISCSSSGSDDSYHTCDGENMEVQASRQPVMKTTEKPGLKLDLEALNPPSKETISSMPTTSIYKCDKPRCGFTTSNPTHIKLHTCSRSQICSQ